MYKQAKCLSGKSEGHRRSELTYPKGSARVVETANNSKGWRNTCRTHVSLKVQYLGFVASAADRLGRPLARMGSPTPGLFATVCEDCFWSMPKSTATCMGHPLQQFRTNGFLFEMWLEGLLRACRTCVVESAQSSMTYDFWSGLTCRGYL